MARLIVKNTFLSLEDEEEDIVVTKAKFTSPRARSADSVAKANASVDSAKPPCLTQFRPAGVALDCASVEQLQRLDRIMSLKQPAEALEALASHQATCGSPMKKVHQVMSNVSISTMAPELSDEEESQKAGEFRKADISSVMEENLFADRAEDLVPVNQRRSRQFSSSQAFGRHSLKECQHGSVPKNLNLVKEFQAQGQTAEPTTLMIRNIPCRYQQRELIQEIEALGFAGTFDFFYAPVDKSTLSNVGYAFVNFISPRWASKCMQVFTNHRFKKYQKASGKIATVSVAHIQGLEANIRHYEKSVVNSSKLLMCRPVIMPCISNVLSSST